MSIIFQRGKRGTNGIIVGEQLLKDQFSWKPSHIFPQILPEWSMMTLHYTNSKGSITEMNSMTFASVCCIVFSTIYECLGMQLLSNCKSYQMNKQFHSGPPRTWDNSLLTACFPVSKTFWLQVGSGWMLSQLIAMNTWQVRHTSAECLWDHQKSEF